MGIIEVIDVVEHEDGSATCTIETDKEATRLLIQEGLVKLIEDHLEAEMDIINKGTHYYD